MHELQDYQVTNQSDEQDGQNPIYHEAEARQIINRLHSMLQSCKRHGGNPMGRPNSNELAVYQDIIIIQCNENRQ